MKTQQELGWAENPQRLSAPKRKKKKGEQEKWEEGREGRNEIYQNICDAAKAFLGGTFSGLAS